MNITILDADTLGADLSTDIFNQFGLVEKFGRTPAELVQKRIADTDIIIVNKVKLNRTNLGAAAHLRLICVTATGYDNIDLEYCRAHNIAVTNVAGYSTESIALVTVATVTSLVTHLTEYRRHCISGAYTAGGVQNCLVPVYHEMSSLTWGVVGAGGIGGRVADIARTLGCRVITHRRTPDGTSVDIDTLCRESDIITLHVPLNDGTRNLISRARIDLMKPTAIVVNMARGAVADEAALCEAVTTGKIGGLGADVYSTEPYGSDSPYTAVAGLDNVILTPHMAWGAYESRVRCMEEIAENIRTFLSGGIRQRVDLEER